MQQGWLFITADQNAPKADLFPGFSLLSPALLIHRPEFSGQRLLWSEATPDPARKALAWRQALAPSQVPSGGFRIALDEAVRAAETSLEPMTPVKHSPCPLRHRHDLEWMHAEAGRCNATAQYMLGRAYQFGLGLPRCPATAVFWLEAAGLQGHPRALALLGGLILDHAGLESPDKGIDALQQAAKMGDADGCYRLGLALQQGCHIQADAVRALACFRQAAEQDHGPACLQLARCYERGLGTGHNRTAALRWYLKAARLREPEAALYLGKAHAEGQTLRQDRHAAIYRLRPAADRGLAEAQYLLAMQLIALSTRRHDHRHEARQWLMQASRKGHRAAAATLATINTESSGMKENAVEASPWQPGVSLQPGSVPAPHGKARRLIVDEGIMKHPWLTSTAASALLLLAGGGFLLA
jgi:TPR repeat protein